MGQGSESLPEAQPRAGAVIRARRQDPRAVWTKRRMADPIVMGKGGNEPARKAASQSWRFIPRSRKVSGAVRLTTAESSTVFIP